MAALLAVMMLLSMAAMTIQLLSMNAYAADITPYYTDDGNDLLIAVGLMYADGVTVGFETRAEYGFTAGSLDADRHFSPLFTTDTGCVSVTCDANLAKTGMTYSIAGPSSAAAVGGWHAETEAGADASAVFALCESAAATYGWNVFRADIGGEVKIRTGRFASRAGAEEACAALASEGIAAEAAGPSDTCVSVIDPYTDRILYEFDGGTETSLGLTPVQSGENQVFLVTPAKNTYGGVFRYTRSGGGTDGVAVTNILPLEEYVEGVLPWEVGNSWTQELLRTFAVAIRSYALSSRKHTTFDLCNGTCCQAYRGRNRTTEAVSEAVRATSGIVLTYDGKIVPTFYSSSTGGTTVSAADAWGNPARYPYLRAVVTPWEPYESLPNASWKAEFTPAQLLAKLNAAGYTSLTGSIKSVEILSYAENSSYVKSLEITDTRGVSVTLGRSDAIRTGLGLNSANFVAAKAGESVTVTDYSLEGEGIATLFERLPESAPQENILPGGVFAMSDGNVVPSAVAAGESVALTGEMGMEISLEPDSLSVLTESGLQDFSMAVSDVPDGSGAETPDIPARDLPDLAAVNIVRTQRTVIAEGTAGNFVFIGRGWGHGVGLSQFGAKALADMGYSHETILDTYFPGTARADYRTVITKEQ